VEYWEEKFNDLLRNYRRLERKYEDLENKNNKLYDELYHANFRIDQELEPRIRQEKRSYDNWVTNPER